MSKLLAIAFSDLHLAPFQAFAKTKYDRLDISFDVWEFIHDKAKEKEVPLLFSGDLLHHPKEIENYILNRLIDFYQATHEKSGVTFACISGNHDLCEKNTSDNVAPSYLAALDKVFPTFLLLDRKSSIYTGSGKKPIFQVYGVPYMNEDKAVIKMIKKFNKEAELNDCPKILLLHTDLPDCPNPQGFVVKDIEGIPSKPDKLWSNFTHVLCGHIHKPTELTNIAAMLGSPIHQNEGDMGCDMGYWEIYDDKKVFKSLQEYFPCFVREGEMAYLDEKDYLILRKDEAAEEMQVKQGKYNTRVPVKKLVSRYMKHKGIKDKAKKQLLTNLLIEAKNG